MSEPEQYDARPCTTEPCPTTQADPTHRSLGQVLNPTGDARCPVCRAGLARAEVMLVQRRVPRLTWWRWLALAVRYRAAPATGWVEEERVAGFGPCGCTWSDRENPLTRLVVEMHGGGAVFRQEVRPPWQAGPHLVLVPAPKGCSCTDHDCEE